MEEQKFISKTEVAKAIGVCSRTVDSLALEGKIRSYRVGTRRLFDLSEVAEDIKNGNAKPADPTIQNAA